MGPLIGDFQLELGGLDWHSKTELRPILCLYCFFGHPYLGRHINKIFISLQNIKKLASSIQY